MIIQDWKFIQKKAFNTTGHRLSALAVWLKDMQKNWFGHMTLVVIIFSAIVFIYLAFHFHWRRKTDGISTSNIVELT